MNKYEILAITPIIITVLTFMCLLEYEIFKHSLLLGLIGNFAIAWTFFFAYKGSKYE